MGFSKRASFDARPNPLTLLLEQKRSASLRVLDLTESNPSHCAFGALESSLLEPFKDPANLCYEPDARGLLRAREAVCAYYASHGVTVHPERIFLTSGTSEAYAHLFHLLCDPGDEVLCRTPVYPLVDHLASFADVRLRRFAGRPEGAAKAVLFVNPANPTGRYADKAEWEAMERYCVKQNAALVSDEVFFDFNWSGRPKISGASRTNGLHFTLNGVSKMLGLPQMKLAWILVSGPEEEAAQASQRLEFLADSYLSVHTASQNALPAWLKRKDAFVAEVLERVKKNFECLRAHGLSPLEPEGGWYALLPLGPGRSDEKTALHLLQAENVLVHPGYFFDLEDECLVVSLLPQPPLFREATEKLARGLAASSGIITAHGTQRNPSVESADF